MHQNNVKDQFALIPRDSFQDTMRDTVYVKLTNAMSDHNKRLLRGNHWQHGKEVVSHHATRIKEHLRESGYQIPQTTKDRKKVLS